MAANPEFGVVVMGVAGCGKSTYGSAIANDSNAPFIEGDSFHPASNIEKMSSGIPLNDEDRWPWLDLIAEEIKVRAKESGLVIIGCSALKKRYRDRLRENAGVDLYFAFCQGEKSLIASRMEKRTGHFMPTGLLDSQFEALEDPRGEDGVLTLDIDQPFDAEIERATHWINAIRKGNLQCP